jgi:hypothetical protein
MRFKMKYRLLFINYASVIVVKLYNSKNKYIKVGISLSKKEDHRLLKLDSIPDDYDNYNAVIEHVRNDTVRGIKITEKIDQIPTDKEYETVMKCISNNAAITGFLYGTLTPTIDPDTTCLQSTP